MGQPSDDGLKSQLLSDFLTMCRLCLTKSSVNVNIFNDSQTVSLPLRIMACASLEVCSWDQLPKRICDECRYQLEKSYVFRKRCKNSDTKLRRYLRQLNTGKVEQVFENSDDEEEFVESKEFFSARQQANMLQIEKEREERERNFQQRMQNFMEEERRRFHTEETKRILEEHQFRAEEKKDVQNINTNSGLIIKRDTVHIVKTEMDLQSTDEMAEESNTEILEEDKPEQIDEEYDEREDPELPE